MTAATKSQVEIENIRALLSRQIAFNSGCVPVHKPRGIEEIRLLQIFIGMIRQAEHDYLSSRVCQCNRKKAEQELFGLHLSPLPGVCRVLGIDPHAARMKLVEWKAKGLIGDPIFGFLTQPGSVDRYGKGQELDIPKLKAEIQDGQEHNNLRNIQRSLVAVPLDSQVP